LSPLPQLVLMRSCWLSYYSEAIGGLPGAVALGHERNYWGDAVTPEMLRAGLAQIPEGATLDVAPVLHPLQLTFLHQQSVLRFRPDLNLRGYDPRLHSDIRYVLVFHRLADPWDLLPPPDGSKVLSEVEREGVVLAQLLELLQSGRATAE
ncbi:MAG: hypothetical protein KDA58_04005, partial [Planctomycetaceae bacterium]|nr:hypothetical protein [Planctomycetaceae bacterium]